MQRTCISRHGSQFLVDGLGFSGAQTYRYRTRGAGDASEATLNFDARHALASFCADGNCTRLDSCSDLAAHALWRGSISPESKSSMGGRATSNA